MTESGSRLGQLLFLEVYEHLPRQGPGNERLRATVAKRGVGERVRPLVGDMAHPGLPRENFDLDYPTMGRLLHADGQPHRGAARQVHR